MKTIKMIIAGLVLYTAQATAQENTLEVWMDKNVTVTADGETVTYLTIREKDPNVTYFAYNMIITLPKGFKIHQKKSNREYVDDITMSDRVTSTHQISCYMPTDGMLKVICTSSKNYDLYSDDTDGNAIDELYTVGLVADSTTINGAYEIEMTDVIFTTYTDTERKKMAYTKLDHTEYCDVTVTGGTDFPGVDYSIPAEGCGTMILPFDMEIPTDMKVFACDNIADNRLVLRNVSSIEDNTPYIVTGKSGLYHFDGTYKALKSTYSTTYMTGVYEQMTVPQGNYVMQNHKETLGIGFYRVGSVETIITPYHCYVNGLSNESFAISNISPGSTDLSILLSIT